MDDTQARTGVAKSNSRLSLSHMVLGALLLGALVRLAIVEYGLRAALKAADGFQHLYEKEKLFSIEQMAARQKAEIKSAMNEVKLTQAEATIKVLQLDLDMERKKRVD